MKSAIDDLFGGNLYPEEDQLQFSSELRRLHSEAANMLSSILMLDEIDKGSLIDIIDLKNQIAEETAKTNFRYGFSLGLRLCDEAFTVSGKFDETGGDFEDE